MLLLFNPVAFPGAISPSRTRARICMLRRITPNYTSAQTATTSIRKSKVTLYEFLQGNSALHRVAKTVHSESKSKLVLLTITISNVILGKLFFITSLHSSIYFSSLNHLGKQTLKSFLIAKIITFFPQPPVSHRI